MKKFLLAGALLLSSATYAKSYFVKLNNQESLNALTESKNLGDKIFGLRAVETNIAPFAVIDSSLTKEELKSVLESNQMNVSYIESNEIDYKMTEYTPVDANYSSQWGLNGNYGIKAETAWISQKGSKDVVVAVVDSGIDYLHPDLKDNLWTNEAEMNGEAGVDDDGNGFVDDFYGINAHDNDGDPMDGNGHGTHCAGVIGATHNDVGIAGVANVKLMGVQIFTAAGRTTVEAIVRGINYAIDSGATVMSNSWGGGSFSQAIFDAVKAADEAGIIFIAAAGNGNFLGWGYDTDNKPNYPSSYELDNVVSVGSITSSGSRSTFSNYGKKSVDLFAPGSNIYSTYKGQTYKSLSGTSMATPHVSGVAGLVASEFPGADAYEIKRRILEGVRKMSAFSDNSVSGGILDAPGALGL